MDADAAAPAAPAARWSGHKSGNANWQPPDEQRSSAMEGDSHPLPRRLPAFRPPGPRSLRTLSVQHPGELQVNPDASRFCAAPESAAIARRASSALEGCSGSVDQPRVAIGDERRKRSRRRSKPGRGRSPCRSAPAFCSVRRERSERYRASSVGNRPTSHRQTSRRGAILRLHLCSSRWGHDIRIRLARFTRCRARFSPRASPPLQCR